MLLAMLEPGTVAVGLVTAWTPESSVRGHWFHSVVPVETVAVAAVAVEGFVRTAVRIAATSQSWPLVGATPSHPMAELEAVILRSERGSAKQGLMKQLERLVVPAVAA